MPQLTSQACVAEYEAVQALLASDHCPRPAIATLIPTSAWLEAPVTILFHSAIYHYGASVLLGLCGELHQLFASPTDKACCRLPNRLLCHTFDPRLSCIGPCRVEIQLISSCKSSH